MVRLNDHSKVSVYFLSDNRDTNLKMIETIIQKIQRDNAFKIDLRRGR